MRPIVPELQWTPVVFSVFLVIDALMAYRIFERLIIRNTPISPDGPLFFVLLLGLQVLLVWLLARLRDTLTHAQRLRLTYEQELNLSRQVMEGTPVGLSVLDEGGHFMYVNRAYSRLLGRPENELLGRFSLDFVEPTEGQTHQDIIASWEHHNINDVLILPFQLRRGDGSLVRVQAQITPRLHSGRFVGSIVSVVELGPPSQAPGPAPTTAPATAPATAHPEKTPQSR